MVRDNLRTKAILVGVLTGGIGLAAGCANDPLYIDPVQAAESDPTLDPDDPTMVAPTILYDLPIRLETPEEAEERALLAAELGIEVPYVSREDLNLSIEWIARNLDDTDALVEVHVNGANEYFSYIPAAFVIDPDEDEEPPQLIETPPFTVPAGGQVSGVLREDQLYEASLDLELITRGGLNPFEAILKNHEEQSEFTMTTGELVPDVAIASMIRFEVSVASNRHVVVEVAFRAKDLEGIFHDDLASAALDELVVFAPADFAPVIPVDPARN